MENIGKIIFLALMLTPMVLSASAEATDERKADPNCTIDLCFVVDASASVRDDWSTLLKFVTNVARKINMRPNGSHICVVLFGSDSKTVVDFTVFNVTLYDVEVILGRINSLRRPRISERTIIARGLRLVDGVFTRKGMRPNVPQIVLLITHGIQTRVTSRFEPGAETVLKAMRRRGIKIMVTGINLDDPKEMSTYVSNPEYLITEEKFSDLDDTVLKQVMLLCPPSKTTPPPPPLPTVRECKKSCARGRLDKVLCQCQCPQSVIQGRVISSSGVPLREVAILLGSPPYTEMARTNNSGHFAMDESCETLSYTVTKNGYIPHRLKNGERPDVHHVVIRLWEAAPAFITVNPKSKTRIAGQSVNFTCEAEGPPPIKITWYHNGRPLPKVTLGNKTNLFIPNVNGAEGLYTCKASNDYGSEISSPAELKIKYDMVDTCNRTPRSHVIRLPAGCTVGSTGQNDLDVGQCSDEPCSQRSSFYQSCGGKEDCCCGATAVEYQEKVLRRCNSSSSSYFEFSNVVELYRVKECACGSCIKQNTVIEGVVVRGLNQDPVENVTVIFKTNVVDTTDEDGKFSFFIPEELDRLTVTFQDPNDRFLDTTLVLPFQRGQTVFHRIALQEEDPPVTFDSTKQLRVPLGHSWDNIAELEIPAKTLMHKNGTLYEGEAKLRVSVMDSRNISDVLSASGDFTTVQSGSVVPLKSYGMLRIKIQDQNNEQLDLAGNMKLRLNVDKIVLPRNSSGEMAPLLWWLDEKTGRWREMGEMRPESNPRTKRAFGNGRFYIGDIQTDRLTYVINIDIPWKRCYVRAQAYRMSGKDVEPAQGVTVTLIGKENTNLEQYNGEESANEEQYYGYTKGVTSKNGIACIPAWCDSNAVLQSSEISFTFTKSGWTKTLIHFNPEKSTLDKLASDLEVSIIQGSESSSFNFAAKVTSQAGPIFGGDEESKCRDPSDDLVAFKFYSTETKQEPPMQFNSFGSRPPGHPLAWYTSDAAKPNQEAKKCFARFVVRFRSNVGAPVIAMQSFTPDRKNMYGFSFETTTVVRPFYIDSFSEELYSRSYACVEYRCSDKDRETFVVAHILSNRCFYLLEELPGQFKEQNEAFRRAMNLTEYSLTDFRIGVSVPVDVSDGILGLFSGPGKIAEERCQAGVVDKPLTYLLPGSYLMNGTVYMVSELPWNYGFDEDYTFANLFEC